MTAKEDSVPGKRASRKKAKRSRKGLVVALVAVALVSALVAWSGNVILSDGGIFSGDDTSKQATASQAAFRSCAAKVAQAEQVVSAAHTGVDHWSAHVQARTDWLRGRISESEMHKVWDRTKFAGPGDQKRFGSAMSNYSSKLRCDGLDEVDAAHAGAARKCMARSGNATQAVATARTAMGDWDSHLKHMASFANGGMTSGQAQRMWVEAWRAAPSQISAYDKASAALAKAPSCSAPKG